MTTRAGLSARTRRAQDATLELARLADPAILVDIVAADRLPASDAARLVQLVARGSGGTGGKIDASALSAEELDELHVLLASCMEQ